MGYYSYKLDHDYGLAPNPFGGYCTLAVCKPDIRRNRNLNMGDWIIGTGSVGLGNLHYLIYTMEVQERITLDQYWNDERFQYKKPVLNGSLVEIYGDNFYHKNPETDEWIQDDSAHSLPDGGLNLEHLKADTNGENVLISQNFFYFGNNAIKMPDKYLLLCNEGRNIKSTSISVELADEFIVWLKRSYSPGIHGDPINWREYST